MKIDDKINFASSDLTQLTAEELFSVVQKLLFFEEPSSRCARMRKLMVKQLKTPRTKEIDVNSMSQRHQDLLFEAIFGARPNLPADRLLSVLIGLEEIARFDEIAFDSWFHEVSRQKSEQPTTPELNNPGFWQALTKWLESANLSNTQREWLIHCAIATPAWTQLNGKANALSSFLLTAHQQTSEIVSGQNTYSDRDFALAQARFTRLLQEFRASLPAGFLPQVVTIVEGPTEEILLPKFAQAIGTDLRTVGVMVVSAGGAKQVARHYLLLRDVVALPVVCVLDKDAEEQASLIEDSIRDCDKLFVLQAGEIEDTFDAQSFARYLNLYMENFADSIQSVSASDFPPSVSRKILLSKLLKSRKLGAFDKVAFAETIASKIKTADDVPKELHEILKFLIEVASDNV